MNSLLRTVIVASIFVFVAHVTAHADEASAKDLLNKEHEQTQNYNLLKLNELYLEDKAWLRDAEPDSQEAKKRRQRLGDAAKAIEGLMQQEKLKHGENWLDNYRDKDGKLPGGFLEDNKSRLAKLKEKQTKQKEIVETLQEKFERLKTETRDADETFEERLLKDQRAYREAFIKEHGDPSEWTDEEGAEYQRGFNELNKSSRQAWEKDRKANSEKMRELGRTIKEFAEAKVCLEDLAEAATEMEKMITDENAFKEPLLYEDFLGIPQIPGDINETAEMIKKMLVEPLDEELLREAETELLEKEDEIATLIPEERKDVEEKPEETKEGTECNYENDFEGEVGPEWSKTSTDKTPSGNRRFLGQFGNETITLRLQAPNAGPVTLAFDLYIINSWDGNNRYMDFGPERWKLSVSGGPILLDASFSNLDEYTNKQSYPDAFGQAEHPAVTGAAEKDSLGYSFYGDSVYNLTYTFQHGGGDVVIAFSGIGLQGIGDESWGLDNVKVQGAYVMQDKETTECMSYFKEFLAEVNKRYKLIYRQKQGIGKSEQKVVDEFDEIFKGDYITAKEMKTEEELTILDKILIEILALPEGIAVGGDIKHQEPNIFMGRRIVPGSIAVKKFDEEAYDNKTEPVYQKIWNATNTIERNIIELKNKHAEFKVHTQACGEEKAENDYKESMKILLNMQNAMEEHTKALVEFREETLSMVDILNRAYRDYTNNGHVDGDALEKDLRRVTNNCTNNYNRMKATLKEFNSFFADYQNNVWHLRDICKQCKNETEQ